jgi:heterodisulfide reductase subunit C
METVDSRNIDPNFKFEIAEQEGGEGILKCYACGTCTARCPEMDVKEEWNPRTVIRKALLGLKEEVLSSEFIWICSAHYRCLDKCPQEVNVKGLMNQIREERLKDEKDGEPQTGRDDSFKYRIKEGDSGKEIYNCFSCGTCTAGCPERDLDPLYSPRKVIKASLLGMKEKVYENRFVEICSTHFRCLEQCPQGVEIPKLMFAIRELAIKEGYTREGSDECN